MNAFKKLSLVTMVLTFPLLLAGCDDGPAETTGEKIDKTMTDMGNKVEDTCESVKEGMAVKDTDC